MKRKTKAQREQEQRNALLIRIKDIYSGAMGYECGKDEWATAEVLSRVIPVMKSIFSKQIEERTYIWEPHNLNEFDNPDTATDFLFKYGFRA